MSWGVVALVLPAIVLLLSYPVFVRYIDRETFGVFILAISLTSIVGWADFGISGSTTKFVAADIAHGRPRMAAETIVASITFFLPTGALFAAAGWFASPWIAELVRVSDAGRTAAIELFRLGSIQLFFSWLCVPLNATLKGFQRFEYGALANTVNALLVYGLGGMLLALAHATANDVARLAVASQAAVLLVVALALSHQISLARLQIRRFVPRLRAFRRILGFSAALALNAVASVLTSQLHRYLIAAIIGVESVVAFQIAIALASKVQGTVNAATEALFPFATSARSASLLRSTYVTTLIYCALGSALVFVVLGTFSDILFEWWIGGALGSQSAALFRPLAIGYFFVCLSPVAHHLCNGTGHHWAATASFLAIGACTTAFVAIAAQYWGTVHASSIAIALAMALNVSWFLAYVQVRVLPHLKPGQEAVTSHSSANKS
ncbi:MAG: oligosaccharide flippase family protein [Betaproteobacteria bacterium]|nr:oligosaccharide flippase family protein [Betaproteobacteria bacterium]